MYLFRSGVLVFFRSKVVGKLLEWIGHGICSRDE